MLLRKADSNAIKSFLLQRIKQKFALHISFCYHLNFLRQVHLELCRLSKTLCTSFGIQIVSEIGTSTMFITMFLYNLYARIVLVFWQNIGGLMFHVLAAITLEFTYVLKIILINHVCKNATHEVSRLARFIVITGLVNLN